MTTDSVPGTTSSTPRRSQAASLDRFKPPPRKAEILAAGVLALIGFTVLLIRMPYRPPVVTTLYSALAVFSFYAYFRWRLGIRMPAVFFVGLGLGVLLDIIGNQYGFFSRRVALIPYDVITHFVTCGLAAIPIMWLLLALIDRFNYRLPLGMVTFFAVTTTLSLAAFYEVLELWDELLLGGHRLWTPRDTPQDLGSDLGGAFLGAVLYALVLLWRRRHSRSLPDIES